MPQPIVQFYDENNAAELTAWNLPAQNASTTSAILKMNIWNNRGGSTAVSDMKDTSVTCLDESLGTSDEIVTDQWMQCKSDIGTDSFTAIGGTNTKTITALGQDTGVIKGTVNSGTLGTDTANYVPIELQIVVPPNATAGIHKFNFRCQYFYT